MLTVQSCNGGLSVFRDIWSGALWLRMDWRGKLVVRDSKCLLSMWRVIRMSRRRNQHIMGETGLWEKMFDRVDQKFSKWFGYIECLNGKRWTGRLCRSCVRLRGGWKISKMRALRHLWSWDMRRWIALKEAVKGICEWFKSGLNVLGLSERGKLCRNDDKLCWTCLMVTSQTWSLRKNS